MDGTVAPKVQDRKVVFQGKRSERSIKWSSNQELGRRLFPKSIVLGIPKRVNMIFSLQRVVKGLRAGRGNSKSSEHTETFTMGHVEENFEERICEHQ